MKKFNNYFDEIFKSSQKYINDSLDSKKLKKLYSSLENKIFENEKGYINYFIEEYNNLIKENYQQKYKYSNKKLNNFLNTNKSNIKVIWGNCFNALKMMDSESIDLMVTSPPYYNARAYSQWKDINEYLADMRDIIRETYRVLDNHKVWVFNVGDIFDNPKTKTKSVWGKTRLPLGAYFIKIFEEEGFTFVDDIIWDKGEVQSKRNKNNATPYPFYQYPYNCYEHILIFHKHRIDLTHFPCPVCGSLNVSGNTQSEPGLQSWECKNNDCFERSKSNRGKRFSRKTNMTQSDIYRTNNSIEDELLKKWRRDIVKFSPVIKINSKGENTLGHTAPFPEDIPEMAIKFFSYKGDKVLDPFAGSFTTPLVAAKLGRIGVGIELDIDLKKIVKKRMLDNDNLFQKIKIEEYEI